MLRFIALATVLLTSAEMPARVDAMPGAARTLWEWICTGAGPSGECAPQPDQLVLDRRGVCLAAAKRARADNPLLIAYCRRMKPDWP
jgi:hypothetical protein